MSNPYALGQLSKAFHSATTHEDPEVRRQADHRAQRWAEVIAGMRSGSIRVGRRTPVRRLPSWVTLEVMRGGFATGRASADLPIQPDEVALARTLGLAEDRRLLFNYFLTDSGLAELYRLLDSGAYRVDVPEDAALLTVAWLVRAGDRASALDILDAVVPYTPRLRFTPKVAAVRAAPSDHVFRSTAADAAAALRHRRPNLQVEVQREALAVWNPLGDRVLTLWLERFHDVAVSLSAEPAWLARARSLLDDYDRLAIVHTLCTKHRQPKQNLAILLQGLRTACSGFDLDARQHGLIRHAITASLAKRGLPGSLEHEALRSHQHRVATAPEHRRLAAVAAARLGQLDLEAGIAHPDLFAGVVTAEESADSGIKEGTSMPDVVPRVLSRAHAAPIEVLLNEGVVPSAEVLSTLLPQISATVVGDNYADQALGILAAANYRAFRRRRSLLLLNLEKQVQLSELPWVRAAAGHRTRANKHEATAVACRIGGLALDHFPAAILPNPLVRELRHLLGDGGHEVPLVEELAADIFTGHFSDKFRRAAQIAASIVGGTLYARYYAIDVEEVLGLGRQPNTLGRLRRRISADDANPTFAELCSRRAGRVPVRHQWSVAANGIVIEQAQILTTHNLAALVAIGARPTRPWAELATDAMSRTATLLALASRQHRPLATVKDAAYAWRQAVFFLSVAEPDEARLLLAGDALTASGPAVMEELVSGLRAVAIGRRPDTPASPFLGWTVDQHPVLDALRKSGAVGRVSR